MALFSIIHSLSTSLGQSVFEVIGEILAQHRFVNVQRQYPVQGNISRASQNEINDIVNNLSTDGYINSAHGIERIRAVAHEGNMKEVKLPNVDLFMRDKQGNTYLFDIKTAKPNKGTFKELKRTLLEWVAVFLAKERDMHIEACIAIPYNPYYPKPYQRWTAQGMFDLGVNLKVAEQFWDFLGGTGTYNELLDCFERVGEEIRPELEKYFVRVPLK